MDANEVNKVAGAILGMATLAMGIGFFSGALVSPKPVVKAGWELPDDTASASASGPAAPAAAAEPIAVRLKTADLAKGEASSKKCVSCHSFTPDGKNGTGPGLYDLVNRDKGTHAGFKYSAAMTAKGGKWDYEALDAFIANPKGYVPNTSMGYAGINRPDERANLILFLRSLAATPAPLPQ